MARQATAFDRFTLLFGIVFWLIVCILTGKAAFIWAPPVTLIFWVFAIGGTLMFRDVLISPIKKLYSGNKP